MLLVKLIVCETGSRWAVALRRQLRAADDPQVYETRYLEDCWQQAAADATCLVALEATFSNLESVVSSLHRFRERLPHVPVLVLAARSLAEGEWLWREAGAVHVVFSPRALRPVISLIRRHLARMLAEHPPTLSAAWQRLPWGDSWNASALPVPDWLQDAAR